MSTEERRAHEPELLRAYHAALLAAAAAGCADGGEGRLGAASYPWARFLMEYRMNAMLAAVTIFIAAADLHAKAAALPAGSAGREHGTQVIEVIVARALAHLVSPACLLRLCQRRKYVMPSRLLELHTPHTPSGSRKMGSMEHSWRPSQPMTYQDCSRILA